MKGYIKIRKKAIEILNSNLSQKLTYHGAHHTFDVLHVMDQYIKRENISPYNAKILRIATLYHDIGFTVSNIEHEKHGAEIAKKHMITFGFSKQEITVVNGLIMATKIPQNPKTFFEKLICDADLDYLGRNDFYPISNQLFNELKSFSLINNKNDWNKAQINFLEAHKYHTIFAQKNRQPYKEKRIAELKKMVKK